MALNQGGSSSGNGGNSNFRGSGGSGGSNYYGGRPGAPRPRGGFRTTSDILPPPMTGGCGAGGCG